MSGGVLSMIRQCTVGECRSAARDKVSQVRKLLVGNKQRDTFLAQFSKSKRSHARKLQTFGIVIIIYAIICIVINCGATDRVVPKSTGKVYSTLVVSIDYSEG